MSNGAENHQISKKKTKPCLSPLGSLCLSPDSSGYKHGFPKLAGLGVSKQPWVTKGCLGPSWACRPGRIMVIGGRLVSVLWAQLLKGNVISCGSHHLHSCSLQCTLRRWTWCPSRCWGSECCWPRLLPSTFSWLPSYFSSKVGISGFLFLPTPKLGCTWRKRVWEW